MKIKLLKRLRKDFKFKFKDGNCYTGRFSDYKIHEYTNIQDMILECYCHEASKSGFWLDWDWNNIYFRHKYRFQQREFDKL